VPSIVLRLACRLYPNCWSSAATIRMIWTKRFLIDGENAPNLSFDLWELLPALVKGREFF
jgi:hypothetical protein